MPTARGLVLPRKKRSEHASVLLQERDDASGTELAFRFSAFRVCPAHLSTRASTSTIIVAIDKAGG